MRQSGRTFCSPELHSAHTIGHHEPPGPGEALVPSMPAHIRRARGSGLRKPEGRAPLTARTASSPAGRARWGVIGSGIAVGRLALYGLLIGSAYSDAQTDEIQVYDASIAAQGTFNLTWHNNYTVSGSRSPAFPGGLTPDHSLNGVTEWAYGATDWFEAGLYLPLYSMSSSGALTYNGVKLRTLFVVPNAAARAFFYGVNFEFSDNARHWDSKAFTSEIRPIIGWRSGSVDFIVNPILDYTSAGVAGLDFAPALRLAYHISPGFSLAAEEYADLGPLRHLLPAGQQQHQLYAVLDRRVRATEIELGAGFGLTGTSDGLVLKLILSRDL